MNNFKKNINIIICIIILYDNILYIYIYMSSYYDKYIKYKNKYLNLKNTFKDYNKNYYSPYDYNLNLVKIRIPKGTIWFRSMPHACEYKSSDLIKSNLKKNWEFNVNDGMYLGNRAILSIAICIEHNKLQEFGIFEVVEDINVIVVKEISNNLYTGKPDESYIRNIYPIRNKHTTLLSNEKILELVRTGGSNEIFLTEKDVHKIKEIYTFKFNPEIIKSVDDLDTYLKANNYPFDFEKYINDKILIESDCPRVKVNGEIKMVLPEFKRVFVTEKEGIVTYNDKEFGKNVLFNDDTYSIQIPNNQISFLFNKETLVPKPVQVAPVATQRLVPVPAPKPVPVPPVATQRLVPVPAPKPVPVPVPAPKPVPVPVPAPKPVSAPKPVPVAPIPKQVVPVQIPIGNYAHLAGIPMKQPRKKIIFTGGDISKYEYNE